MVKTRLIPVLYIKNGFIVRSEGFDTHLLLGNVIDEASRYNEWEVDELIYIDISRTQEYDWRRDDHKVKSFGNIETIINEISKVCFMPLTFGGGIRSIEQIDTLIKSGADKITLNTGAFDKPKLISETSRKYGAQCVVLSIDYRVIDGKAIVHTEFGTKNTGKNVLDWVKEVGDLGAGEIFLNSIDRDGKGNGYDIDTINRVVQSTKLPIIACGGAADSDDFVELAEESDVSAIAAGNLFHFKERAYPNAKKHLKKYGIDVR